MPNYDEFLIAYEDREHVRDERLPPGPVAFDEYAHFLIIDGRLRGTWRRTLDLTSASIEVRPLRPLSRDERQALAKEGARYGRFVGRPVTLTVV